MRSATVDRGAHVEVLTAFGRRVEKIAVSGVIHGDRFEVVRVCSEEEWVAANEEHREPRSSPWPADDVQAI